MHPSLYNTFTEIQLKKLVTNLRTLKKGVRPTASVSDEPDIMAVIKADAYGHGAVPVARALEDHITWFAVASVREAIELREADITKPILVLGVPDRTNRSVYKSHKLTATVSAFEHFEILPEGTSYHLNFDTGMGRLGFYQDQLEGVLYMVKKHSHCSLDGIMSHFATADEPSSHKVHGQWQIFNRIQKQFPASVTRHVANTGGSIHYQKPVFDMVRLGIGLYGYPPGSTPISGLQPVMKWKSHLAQVKPIEMGMTVSYLAKWRAPCNGFLGVIPVGYGDGYPRNASGEALVGINGEAYQQVGMVTMDYMMVWLDQDEIPVNTEVTVMGAHFNNATRLAELADTINYEILCRLTDRVERVYLR